jgi:dTDP-glucose 4,6-dehydratase
MAFSPLPGPDLDHVLAHSRDLREHARGRRIFLTGGSGFFGPWLVESFAHANERLGLNAELVLLTRDPEATLRRLPHYAGVAGVTIHKGDVRSFDRPAGRFDFLIHGAAESSQQGHVGDHRRMLDTIVDGTRQTLDLARSAGAAQYLLLSSGAVYGRQPPDVSHIPEDFSNGPDLSAPGSAYGEGKRVAEVFAAIAASQTGLSVRVARCFAFVGPHLPLDIHFAIGNFIRDAMAGGPIRIRGDGTAVRSYLYMADLAVWLWTLALSTKALGAYNVGSEQGFSILELAQLVARGCAPSAAIDVADRPQPGIAPHRYLPSTARAFRELGLQQRITLDDAIRRTVDWHRQSHLTS